MAITDMKKVELLGVLGKKFGRTFNFDIKTPSEAIRALCINIPELKQFLLDSDKKGIAYKVIVGKEAQAIDDLWNPLGKQSIKIVPVLQGAGGGGGGIVNVIAGAALVAVGVAINVISGGTLAPVGNAFIAVGVGMMIGGVAQMLSPTPTFDLGTGVSYSTQGQGYGQAYGQAFSIEQTNNQTADNRPSYVFNGAVNTTAQGNPVPIGYGRVIVGSSVISASIRAEELA